MSRKSTVENSPEMSQSCHILLKRLQIAHSRKRAIIYKQNTHKRTLNRYPDEQHLTLSKD